MARDFIKEVEEISYPTEHLGSLKRAMPLIMAAIERDGLPIESGLIDLGAVDKGLDVALFFFYWVSETNEIIENINAVLTDMRELPTNYAFLRGSPKTRYYLLVRTFFYEFYRFREIYHQVATPREAQTYLNKIWSRIRSRLDDRDLTYYGMRVVKPQHDDTPHWHLLFFMPKEHVEQVGSVIQDYAMREDGDEAGAAKHRYKEEHIDRSKGTAASYIAKYISKNIDGFGLDCDIDGGEPISAAERVRVWASTWGIRQFQPIGGPSVTLWRELRRMGEMGVTGELKELRDTADKGEWDRFVMLMGGPQAKRKNFPITLAKQWNDKPNRYGEPKGEEVIGIAWEKTVFPTRIHQWVISHKSEPESKEGRLSLKRLRMKTQ
ncbi:replication endonuclease [Nitrosospira sp. NpAV]|uniref:replication endonuclease n=1 Tax=Nitrosospira sp. NpAV TaxID=58133 RepID=UPI00069612A8|nr:replication endonuclease [Nitrosospira sp. NpAV]